MTKQMATTTTTTTILAKTVLKIKLKWVLKKVENCTNLKSGF